MKNALFAILFIGFIVTTIGVVCDSTAMPRWLGNIIKTVALGGVLMTAVCAAVARF